jgi:hypothetical protein
MKTKHVKNLLNIYRETRSGGTAATGGGWGSQSFLAHGSFSFQAIMR